MAGFNPRSMKQRLADSRLTIDRGPTVGEDSQPRDPFMSAPAKKRSAIKSPSFSGRVPSFARGMGRGSLGR